jgi:hypothetical protein
VNLRQLIGNPAAYATQYSDGSWKPVRKPLDDISLDWHRKGDVTVGTYIVVNGADIPKDSRPDGVVAGKGYARTLVFDIDSGDQAGEDALSITNALERLGLPRASAGSEYSGRKGVHVWVVFQDYVPAVDLRRLGLAALVEAGVKAEVFPKQNEVRDLGNLVKLPEGVHRVTGARSEWISEPRPLPVKTLERVLQGVPEVQAPSGGGRPDPFPCMAHAQKGVPEGGRNRWLFHLAVMLRRGGLNDENVAYVVGQASNASDPPLEPGEVAALLESSRHSGPLCRQLEGEVGHCGEACILRRVEGLRTRPGQVAHAAAGEKVVVTVGERKAHNVVEIEHEDIDQGRAQLR